MIAKRIARRKDSTSSFARLGKYVVDARGQEDPLTWKRTADYILDEKNEGQKVGGVRITNCAANDPADATMEVLATQAQNTRSKSDKNYHLVVSFPKGEKPVLETLHAIEDRLCAAIGLADHQRLSAIHTDTDHLHIHVAINKVHPTTRKNVEPYYDKARLMEECAAIERDYGLQRTNHGLPEQEQARKRKTTKEKSHERPQRPDRHTAAVLRQSYAAALAEQPTAKTLDGVRTLSSVELVRFPQGPESVLQGDARHDVEHGRAAGDHALRRPGGGAVGAGSEDGRAGDAVSGKAGDMEAHAGQASLLGWIKREVKPAIEGAKDWQGLHSALAEHGLEIRPRGAGLVVATTDGKIGVKASDVDRRLAMAALTKKFGPFEPPAPGVRDLRAAKTYRPAPKHPHKNAPTLFAEYQRAKVAAQEARNAARATIREKHAVYAQELASYHQKKRGAIQRSRMPGQARKAAYAALAAERTNDWQQRKALEAAQRAEIATLHPAPVWQDWLAQRAGRGDIEALDVLRSQERKKQRFKEAWLSAGDTAAAKSVVYAHIHPHTDKTGTVNYEVGDGGLVKDMRDGVRVDKPTEAASFLALLLASDKFAGQALIVEGSDAFKSEVAKLAGEKGMDVQFADPELEKKRLAARQVRQAPVQRQALEEFIEQRNAQREKISTIVYHRKWEPTDAGEAVYQGRRRLGDGSEAVLLQRGETMLVMPASNAQAAKASTWPIGTRVSTDQQGRFVGANTEAAKQHQKGKTR